MWYKNIFLFSNLFLIWTICIQQAIGAIRKEDVYELAEWTSKLISNYTSIADASQYKFKAILNIENIKPNIAFTNTKYTLTLE